MSLQAVGGQSGNIAMENLERFWDAVTHIFGGLLSGFERLVTNLFGSSNARYVKSLQSRVDAVNALGVDV